MVPNTRLDVDAYALGYYHGRATGVYDNPYNGGLDVSKSMHQFYMVGYDRGVGDFCEYDLIEGA